MNRIVIRTISIIGCIIFGLITLFLGAVSFFCLFSNIGAAIVGFIITLFPLILLGLSIFGIIMTGHKKQVENESNIEKLPPNIPCSAKSKASPFPNYVVVDLETTGFSPSNDRIIEIAAVKVIDDKIVENFSMLVNPHAGISKKVEDTTHITNLMVANAPSIEEVLPQFWNFINGSIIVGHSVAFDIRFLIANFERIGLHYNCRYIDTLEYSRKALPNLNQYRLIDLCNYFHVGSNVFHRALADCVSTHECFQQLMKVSNKMCIKESDNTFKRVPNKLTDTNMRLQQLYELLCDIMADNIVTSEEVYILKDWIDNNDDLFKDYPYNIIVPAVNRVLADGVITNDESNELRQIFQQIINPKFGLRRGETLDIAEKSFVLTGQFTSYNADDFADILVRNGGILMKSVSSKTDYLIVGSDPDPRWHSGNFGTKIKKAMELRTNGDDIIIATENETLNYLRKQKV